MKKTVLFMERYSQAGQRICETLEQAGCDCCAVVLEDDGFLIGGGAVISPYEYYIRKRDQSHHDERRLHYAFLEVPEFWEIRTDGIYDMGRKKAVVYCTEPAVEGTVQRVEWQMENGWVYRIDYYDKYGLRYASEFLGRSRETESKVYYSDSGQEVIIEQPQNDTITLCDNSGIRSFFTSYDEFIECFLEDLGIEGKYLFFPEEEKGFRFLNLTHGGKTLWDGVIIQKRDLIEKYIEVGGKRDFFLYELPESYPVNQTRGEALILTASDQIESISELAEALPYVNFHIAAHTQVSDKPWSLRCLPNIEVYPQIGQSELASLWLDCDFYLDINYYHEIYDAVNQASRRNLLILGFGDTLHDRKLTVEECVFAKHDYEGMVQTLVGLVGNQEAVNGLLARQQERRHSGWNNLEKMLKGMSEETLEIKES